jgi:hypothetical protein
MANAKALKGRAKSKTITQTMMLNMVDIVGKSGLPDRKTISPIKGPDTHQGRGCLMTSIIVFDLR